MIRKILFSIIALTVAVSVQAQSPQKFKFQAVARDASGVPYASENIAVRVSLVRDGVSGLVDYSERHEVTTSPLGVFDLEIGGGVAISGIFENAQWGNYPYYLKIDIDPNGGDNYLNLGTSQLLSVPYAIYAGQSGNGGGDDPTDELQNLIYNPATQTLTLTDGNSVTLSFPGGGSDDQILTLSGTTLSIEDGNSIDLSSLQDGVNDADADPTNELQVLDLNGTQLHISDGNNVDLASIQDGVNDADADPMNEIQSLSLNGTQISISDGNQIDLAPIIPPGGTDDQQLSLNGTTLTIEDGNSVDLASLQDGVNDADSDPTNEFQVLDLNGTQLHISDGNNVDLASIQDGVNDADADPMNEIQDISFNPNTNELTISSGSTVTLPSGGTDADADPTNELQVLDLNGTQLHISDGNNVDLASIQDGVNDADADPMNEIQSLSLNGTQISISDGNQIDLAPIIPPGGTDDQQLSLNGTTLAIEDGNSIDLASIQDGVNDADADPMNEIQDISFNPNTNELTISSGSTVTLPSGGTDADADPTNELQVLDLNGTQISISDGNQIDLAPIIPPGGTDDQQLSLNGTTLAIEDGNSIDLASIQDGVNDADADPTNEFQVLDLNGTQISISDGNQIDLAPIIPPGGTDDQQLSLNGTTLAIEDGNSIDLASIQDGVNDADADPTNEFQVLDLNGTQLHISDGNNVDLASLQDGVNDADADPMNEIQTISKTGLTVNLSNGGGSFLDEVDDADPDPTNEFQVLDLNGTQLHISNGNNVDLVSIQDGVNDADADPTNEIQTMSLTGSTLNLSNSGGSVDLSGIGGSSLWSQNNNEVYYDAGFVGIGTDNPSSILDVGALNDVEVLFRTFSQQAKVGLKIQNNLENNGYLETAYQGIGAPGQFTDGTPIGGTGSLLLGNAAERLAVGTKGNAPIHIMTDQQTHMYVSNNGKIGIGTTTPANKFVVRDTEFTKASIETPDAGGNAELALIVDNGDANFDLEIELNGPDYGGNYNDGTPLAGTGSVLSGADASRMVMGAISGPLHLFSGGNTNMFLNSNGRVGIGTTAPQTEMHLFGEDARFTMQAETEDDLISLDLSTYPDMTGTRDFRLSLYPGSNTFDFEDGTSSADAAVINTGTDVSRLALNADNGPVHLMTGGNTRLFVKENGNIGIGTNDPQDELHLDGDLRLDGDTPSIQFHNNTNWSGYMYHDATDLILGNIFNNKILLQTNATNTGALDNTGLELNRGDHRLKMGNFGSGNSPMIEATNNGAIDVLGITASGVSISKTGNVTSTPYVLRVVEESTPYGFNIFHSDSENHWELYTSSTGDLRLYGNNSFRGAFDATSGAYTEVSDRRFKTNIRPLTSIMDNIMALKPYRYQYKDNNPKQKESLGFVAQEVQQLFPELVQEQKGERENGVLSLNYSGFSVLAIHAIQQQQQTIEQQQAALEKQAKKIESLEARLERLEALLDK